MMDIIEISEDNLDIFSPLLGEDLSEDVKRIYFYGIGAIDEDERVLGALVFELLNSESEEDTKSRICFLKSESAEISENLLNYYFDNSVEGDEIVESIFKTSDEADEKTLTEAGFSFSKEEDEKLTVTLSELSASKIGKKKQIPEYVGSIDELSILEFRNAVKETLFKGHTGILEDIPYLPMNWFENSISACTRSGDTVTGLFLIRKSPSGILTPVLLFAMGPESRTNLLFMLRYSLQQAFSLYPPDTVVEINRKDPSIRALTDNILPGRKGNEVFFGTRKEN